MTQARRGAAALAIAVALLATSAAGVSAANADDGQEPRTVTVERYEGSGSDRIERAPSPAPGTGGEVLPR
jgi:hypothetical protein